MSKADNKSSTAKPISLAAAAKARRQSKAKGRTLCARGFHKWTDAPRKQFDVKQGKLVSIQQCARCGAERTTVS